MAQPTEDNRDVGAAAQAPQSEPSNPPPQTQSGEGQGQREAVTQAEDKLKTTNEQEVAQPTEDNRDVGAAAQAPQPDSANPPPHTQSGEGQEQGGAVIQAEDKLKTTNEQEVAQRTEDNRDVGAVAQAPQPDTSNPPPHTQSGEGQEQGGAVIQAEDKFKTTNEQEVAQRTEDNRDVAAVAQAPQPDTSNPPPQPPSGVGQQQHGAVAQAEDKLKTAQRTEDNRDVGAAAQAPQSDASKPPPQTQSGEEQETFSQAELDQLVAPIALYPDALLARVLMAATYPDEVLEASRWVKQNKSLQGSELKAAADQQRWDYSVKQLTATPSVLAMMSDKIHWTEKLGDAVLAQQADLMDAVQRLRAMAQSHGKLKTTDEQKVSRQREGSRDPVVIAATEATDQQAATKATDQQKVSRRREGSREAIVIEATKPDTIYVPYYNPAVVYGEWAYPDYPPYYWPGYYYGPDPLTAGIVFAAFGVGAWVVHDHWWGGDFDWHRRHIHHRRNFNDHNRDATRWSHNPDHRRGVRYKNRDVADKFDRNRDSRAARKLSRDTDGVAGGDRRDRRANVDHRAGSDRKAAQKPASNKQVQRADPSQRRLVQDPAARRSDLRADGGRQTRMQADRHRPSQMRMQADRHRPSQMRMQGDWDRRSFAAQRSVERAMRGWRGRTRGGW